MTPEFANTATAVSTLRETGRIPGARWSPSPNYGERPAGADISLLVVHNISLPPGQFGGDYIEHFFHNRLDPGGHPYFASIAELCVSAHALIRRDGTVVQFVSLLDRAWHAGRSQFRGRDECNDFSIGVELEGTDELPYETAQYATLADLAALIMAAWPEVTAERIAGHCDIAPGRKTDPGAAFDWRYFHHQLNHRIKGQHG
ncbi:1,6-anhydro-N-acetylmuramyl-L-alanine amidase AmpD [Marinobacter sp. X15-166B]|uniref:1,6-anhydro-N-acetylmuramyl-L-alanine amidase AmpD n=1 Tax=Marinobacter sp. X15-166B TaxID=1897620 RepID=UPI000A64570D